MYRFKFLLLKIDKNILFITLICILLFATNYTKNTYLLGWDSIQTDLNPLLGIKRAFFAVWQEYQSFGLLTGMAHAADLVRAIIILLMSFVLPNNALRFTFHMGMGLTGGLGMLLLLKSAGFDGKKNLFALIGSLFYILNFSIIQLMFLPFESFSVFLGLLPFEIWIFLKTLEEKNISYKNLLTIFGINFLATPQSVSQQLFVVYIAILVLMTIGIFVQKRKLLIKNVLVIFSIVLLINSFWLIPQIYSFKNSFDTVKSAKINQVASSDLFYSNKDKGNLKDFFSFTGFLYDRLDKDQQPIFIAWKNHRNNPLIIFIIYSLSLIYLIGVFKKTKFRIAFLLNYFFITIALLIDTSPFSFINQILRQNGAISELFRSPFTKFAIPYALISSYFFACGASLLYDSLKKIKLTATTLNIGIFSIIIIVLILIASLPAFQGNYISKTVKVNLPKEYFSVFDYFKNQSKSKRIAILPDYTFWGWFHNKWGYDGSGFLWYGIEQPIISRTFDVWSDKSEGYFWELKSALEAENIESFEKILEKYNIDYIIYDESILPVVGSSRSLQYNRLASMLKESKIITLDIQWNFISVYKVTHKNNVKDFIQVSDSLPNIGPRISLTNSDTAYSKYGRYMTSDKKPFDIYYPFLDLTTQTDLTKKSWNIFELPSELIFTASLPFEASKYHYLFEPQNEFDLFLNGKSTKLILPLSSTVENNTLIMHFPKLKISNFNLVDGVVENCSEGKGLIDNKIQDTFIFVQAEKGATACLSYTDQDLNQQYGYLIKIDSENIQGQRLLFYILDRTKEQNYLEDRIKKDKAFYVIAPRFAQGRGYSFIFHNNSYENIVSTNQLNSLDIYLIPYEQIKNVTLQKLNTNIEKGISETNFSAGKMNYFSYSVISDSPSNKTLTLYQAFDPGWKAYRIQNSKFKIQNWINSVFPFLFGKEIEEHIVINNWANGWILDNNSTIQQSNNSRIVIIFWPQYLEYLGFGILISTFLWLAYSNFKKPQRSEKQSQKNYLLL